ncbi:MAG: SDR family NAD(P)-dependent oxidoreductase [Deltaproteobacteria bacterium]|nr:SDR family NAD(P)-dependent oxidoreductase [Deltaproteobacteria bacterium]
MSTRDRSVRADHHAGASHLDTVREFTLGEVGDSRATTRAPSRRRIARGHGEILNIASAAAFQPTPWMAAFGASKTFIRHYSEALANELEDAGVTVSVVSPGPTETEFFGRLRAEATSIGHFAGDKRDTARHVAEVAVRTLDHRRLSTVVGLENFWLSDIHRFAPRSLVAWISKSIMAAR